jgi:hypothetical protein
MPAPRPIIGLNDLHLLAKVLDAADDEFLKPEYTQTEDGLFHYVFSVPELRRCRQLFQQLDEFLDETFGEDWNDQEALV